MGGLIASLTSKVTGNFMLDAEVAMRVFTLTDLLLGDGQTGQEIFMCPA